MTLVAGKVEEKKDGEPSMTASDFKKQIDLMKIEFANELKSLKEQNKPLAAPTGGLDANQFRELIETVVKSVKEKPDDQKYGSTTYTDEKDIDPDDFDDVGVMFSALSTGYVVVDDKRKGKSIQTPFRNVILFGFNAMIKTRDSRGKEVLNTFCSYTSHSKTEQQWLRGHTYFGIKFFESHIEALNANAAKAQKISHFIDIVGGYDNSQLMQLCKQHNVSIGNDPHKMRTNLAMAMYEKATDIQEQGVKKMLKEKEEESIFLEDKTKRTPHTTT